MTRTARKRGATKRRSTSPTAFRPTLTVKFHCPAPTRCPESLSTTGERGVAKSSNRSTLLLPIIPATVITILSLI